MNDAFNVNASQFNNDPIVTETGQDTGATILDDVTRVLLSIFKIFFWTFNDIPFFLDLLVFVPFRIILAVLVYRNIRGVGG